MSDSIRIYCHSVKNESYPAWVEHTFVFTCATGTASPNIKKLKTAFKEDLFRLHFSKDLIKLPIMTQGVLRDINGKELQNDSLVAEVVEDRDDVFFELKDLPKPVATATKPVAASSSSSSSSSSSKKDEVPKTIQIQTGNGAPITINRSELGNLGVKDQLSFAQLSQARDHQAKGQLRKARDIYLQVLKSLPNDKSEGIQTCRQICHQQLGVIYLYNRFYDLARPHLEAAVKIITSSTSGANGDVVKNIGKTPQLELSLLTSLVGQCCFGQKDWIEAQPHFERALKLLTPKGDDTPKDPKLASAILDAKVWLARCLYRGGVASERNQALQMFEQIIHKNEHHIGALTYYAQIAVECGKSTEVIPYILRALVASQQAGPQKPKGASPYEAAIYAKNGAKDGEEPKYAEIDPQLLELVQTMLTDLVQEKNGVKTLFNELHGASTNLGALSFLAQTLKDQGGVSAAIEIYRKALVVCDLDTKGRNQLVLNLIHTMELEYQYQQVFDEIKNYLKANLDLKAGSLAVKDFYAAIENIKDIYDVKLRLGTAQGVPAWTEIGKIFDEGKCHVYVPMTAEKKSTAIPYPADELNVMALLFTCVKILYVCGGLQVIPTLVNLLEPLRTDRDLHLTQIRNEHAYYSTIAQLMRSIVFPLPASLAHAPIEDTIYVCGDSHSMSPAWQVIQLDGHPRPVLLQPKLVTGLKCWHLRPQCRFYPKRNFEACMKSIPSKATVIFNFGEIDCREGLLLAVEKGRYETIDEGINLAVKVYIDAMKEQQATKKLKIFVHPIVPVLDPTRNTVKQFTATLKEKVDALKSNDLQYLDFFSSLLTPDGTGFNMKYHLDSTHLKPSYAHDLLQPALNKVFGDPKLRAAAAAAAAVATAASSSSSSSSSSKSTIDSINEKLLKAQMGDFADDENDPNAMD